MYFPHIVLDTVDINYHCCIMYSAAAADDDENNGYDVVDLCC